MSTISYIFCINTGRSGSDYLRKIFQHVQGCQAFHEAEPIGNGSTIRDFFARRHQAVREFTKRKLEVIEAAREGASCYFESNHCFIKGFGWYLPYLVGESSLGVIQLYRDKERVVDSTLRIGSTPLSDFGRHWIITPDVASPLTPPPTLGLSACSSYRFARAWWKINNWVGAKMLRRHPSEVWMPSFLRSYERRCVEWYVDETSALADAYVKSFPAVRHLRVSIDELNNIGGIERVLAHFGLKALPSMLEVVGRATNLAR